MISGHTRAIVLLGAQRFDPTLGEAVAELKIEGKIAAITAGWQEREEEDDDLREHLGGRTVNLRLHARAEEVFRDDEELKEAHRDMQTILRHRQDFYRIRLEHALDAQHVIDNRKAPPDILEDEARASIQAIRDIDRMHLERCVRDREEFDARMRPLQRPSIKKHIEEIEKIIKDCDALAIAGGHVASLLNRLRLFDIRRLAKGKVVFAWCAGAMAISERIIIFHHAPPQGPAAVEVLDEGLGLAGDVVVLPQPEMRLNLDDRERIQTMARRFAPATCLAMPARSRVTWKKRGPENAHGVISLRDDGMHIQFEESGSGVFQHRGVLGS
jgi:hypothetical protein